MTTPIAQMSVEMAKVSIAMQKGTKATQVLRVAQVKLLQTALGPVYDLFLDMKLAVAGVIAVFKPFNRVTTQTGETMLVLQGPLGFILKAFTDIRLVGLFLMSILLSLGAVMSVTGSSTLSFSSAVEVAKAGFDFLIEVISSTITYIQSFNFEPIISAFSLLFDYLITIAPIAFDFVKNGIDEIGNRLIALEPYVLAYVDLWIASFTSLTSFLVDFYTALNDAGVFTAVIGLVYSYLEAWEYVFDGVQDGFKAAGISGDGFEKTIKNSLSGLMSYIEASGILELSARFINALGKVLVIWGKVLGAVLKWLIIIVVYISGPLIMAVKGSLEIIFVAFKTVIEVITELLEGDLKGAFVALLSGIKEIFTIALNTWLDIGAWALSQIVMALSYLWGAFVGFFTDLGTWAYNAAYSMWDSFTGFISGIIDFIWGIPDALMQAVSDAMDALTDFDLSSAIGGVLDIDVLGGLGFSDGGIAKGPTSGYPVTLHGTEAVVPLPDGKTIPVALQGAMPRGGDNVSFNINISGSKGDPKEVAKLVGKEVQRAFRTRSRSGGYGRGI
jgi:hypothetical protein